MKILDDDDTIRRYELEDGREITIELEEDGREIIVRTSEGKNIGHFELKAIHEEGIDDDEWYDQDPSYKLMWMGLEEVGGYKRLGIGAECIRFHKEYYQSPIYASPNDGQTRDDGSHLINDGGPFVAKMVALGLIEDNNEHDSDDEREDEYYEDEELDDEDH